MSLPVYVDTYSGYNANERPRQFVLDDEFMKSLLCRSVVPTLRDVQTKH